MPSRVAALLHEWGHFAGAKLSGGTAPLRPFADFLPLFERRAIAVVHPDLASSGGILETKKIGDLAQEHGIAMALHMAMSPIAALASVHCAAATENFMVLENHSVDDLEGWSALVTGLPVPLIEDGHIAVPEAPGLGFSDLNEDVLREFADPFLREVTGSDHPPVGVREGLLELGPRGVVRTGLVKPRFQRGKALGLRVQRLGDRTDGAIGL